MNEDERRRIYKAKRKRQKKKRKERKKEEARQARNADRLKRIQQEAERIVQARVDKGELIVRSEQEGNAEKAVSTGEEARNDTGLVTASKDCGRKRENTGQQQEGPPKKIVRRQSQQHALKEISSDQITRTAVYLGSGSYSSCYLGLYRGLSVVVKELRVKQLQRESREEAEARVSEELVYEARILNKLGDHPGLPLLFGVRRERAPYRLIMQFHGNQDGSSHTISTALVKRLIPDKVTWTNIIVKTAEALSRVHEKGFLHNDLKSNNVVLDNKNGVFNPVVIDFGKSVPMSGARGPKFLSAERQKQYAKDFPHIVGGLEGQSIASDIFSLAKLGERIFLKAELGSLPLVLVQALNVDPTKRPALDKIVENLLNLPRLSVH